MATKSALDKVLADTPAETPQEAKAIIAKSNLKVAQAQALAQKNASDLKAEARIGVTLAPMYRNYFGDVMTVSLNGLNIYVPIDGRTYQVPIHYAQIIQERRRRVDDHVMRTQRMSDVQSNFERTAGELVLVPR